MRSATQLACLSAVLSVCTMLAPARGLAQQLPVPAEADLEQALGVVKDVFEEEYAAARSNVRKQELAKKMLDAVAETKNPVDRFALLQVARQVATAAGDGVLAYRAVEEMARSFRIDAVRLKAAVLYDLSKKAQTAVQHKSVAKQCFALADEAIRGDELGTASKLADMALAASRKAGDSQLGRQIVAFRGRLDDVVQAHEKAKQGLKKLETSPADPTANLDAGKYVCFVKGDWSNGLAMLALGNGSQLKEIAVQEIGAPLEAAQRAEIGDAWWELAEQADGLGQAAMYARAAYHYRLVAPQVKGLLSVKIKRRLEQLAEGNTRALRLAEQMAGRSAPATLPPSTGPHGAAVVTETPHVPPGGEAPAVSRVVTIPANSAKGYVIGPVAKETRITLQYVSGKWKGWGSRGDICPDKTDGRGGTTCLLAIVAFDSGGTTSQLVTVVPQGTTTTPFSYQVKQDVPLLVLRIKGKGNKWSGNPGKVQYKLTVTPPPGA